MPAGSSELVINPGEYLLLWLDNEPQEGDNHVGFKLKQEGDAVYLYNSSLELQSSLQLSFLWTDVSFGRSPDLSAWFVFEEPTPGSANGEEGLLGILESPQHSVESGFIEDEVFVQISHPNPDVDIYYSINGSQPNEEGILYTGPVEVEDGVTLKSVAYAENYLRSQVIADSYIEDEDYGLSMICLSVGEDYFWGSGGIYDHPFLDVEVPIDVVYISSEGEKQFSQTMGVKIQAPDTRDQKSLRFYARGTYGKSHLEYPLFPTREYESVKRFILRNAGNDGVEINHTGLRDPLIHQLFQNIDPDYGAAACLPVLVFLNGEEWGMYNMRERQDEHWLESMYGYEEDETDFLERSANAPLTYHAISGNWDDYDLLEEMAIELDLSLEENYEVMQEWMDVEDWIDYQLLEIFIVNQDWLSNNMKFWRSYDEGGKWRWVLWDTDWGFGTYYPQYPHGFPDWNAMSFATSNWGGWTQEVETELLQNMLENEGFASYFSSRAADLCNAWLRPDNIIHVLDSLKNQVEADMPFEFEAWDVDEDYWNFDTGYIATFVEGRPEFMRQQITDQLGWGEVFTIDIDVEPVEAGWSEVNTIHTDELPWNGYYFENLPVRLKAIANPGYVFHHWEGSNGGDSLNNEIYQTMSGNQSLIAVFEPGPDEIQNIVINEIQYWPSTSFNSDEWIELYNPGQDTVFLQGWTLCDGGNNCVVLSGEIMILPQDFIIIAANTASFGLFYPGVANVIGGLDFNLANEGEALRLYHPSAVLVDEVVYQISSPWPAGAQGTGASIELLATDLNNALGSNWFANTFAGGSPGEHNTLFVNIANQKPTHLGVFPNPFNDVLSIVLNGALGEVNYQLFDALGSLVGESQFTASSNQGSIRTSSVGDQNLQDLTPGLYLLTIQSKTFQQTVKLQKLTSGL